MTDNRKMDVLAQVRALVNDPDFGHTKGSFGGPGFDDSVQRIALKQLMREQGLRRGLAQVKTGALRKLDAALGSDELAVERPQQVMSDREVSDRLHQRDPAWWAEIQVARSRYGDLLTGHEPFA